MISAENHQQNPVGVETVQAMQEGLSRNQIFVCGRIHKCKDKTGIAVQGEAGEYGEPPKKIPSSELTYPPKGTFRR